MTEIDKIVESIADDIRPEVESIEANKNLLKDTMESTYNY